MTTRRKEDDETSGTKRPAATTPEAREMQLVNAAVELAEKQIRNGTASSQIITHYLKLGTTRERLEQEKLSHENELLQARKEALASQARVEELYAHALDAMRSYAGLDKPESYDED